MNNNQHFAKFDYLNSRSWFPLLIVSEQICLSFLVIRLSFVRWAIKSISLSQFLNARNCLNFCKKNYPREFSWSDFNLLQKKLLKGLLQNSILKKTSKIIGKKTTIESFCRKIYRLNQRKHYVTSILLWIVF